MSAKVGSAMLVRAARSEDLPDLLALYRHLNPTDQIPSLAVAECRLQELLSYPGSTVFLGIADASTVASCTLVVIPNLTRGGQPYGLIENVVTHADHRGRGYGKQVLQAAIGAAWEAGCYKVMLMTGSKDPATLAFYAAAGFEQSKTGFQVRRLPARTEA